MSDIPAVQAEATGAETITVEYGGHTYTVSATVDGWDFETLELFEAGKSIAASKAILGEEQFATFKATKPTVRDFNALMETIAGRYGFENAGE